MGNLIDYPVSIQRGWDYLLPLELRLKVPRPQHDLSDSSIQQAWKKTEYKSAAT